MLGVWWGEGQGREGKGKSDLMLSQISTQTQEEEEPVTQQPLLQYEEGRGSWVGGGGKLDLVSSRITQEELVTQ